MMTQDTDGFIISSIEAIRNNQEEFIKKIKKEKRKPHNIVGEVILYM